MMGGVSIWHWLALLGLIVVALVLIPCALVWLVGLILPQAKEILLRLLRTYLGVLAGVVAAWFAISICEFLGASFYPPPPGTDFSNPQALAAYIASAPLPAMLIVVAGWTSGTLIGSWIAARIASYPLAAAVTVATGVLLGVIANNMMIPHPQWMTIAGVLLPIPLAWLAARMATPRTPR